MSALILPTHTSETRAAAIARAVALLAQGDVVALPAETVYGLAADATHAHAVAKIFAAKARPSFDPLIVHLPRAEALESVAALPTTGALRTLVARLTTAFWPGPLTLVLPAQPGIVGLVTSGLPTVAVRWSAHPLFAAVIEQFGKPLAAPSANRFGRISPTEAAHVASELGSDIPLILDGGSCTHGVESTIALPSEDGTSLSILRAGPISLEALAEFCPVHRHVPKSGHVPAPGFLAQHYAPSTPVLLVQNAATPANQLPDGPIGCLAFRHLPPPGLYERVEILSASGDLREAAATLFAKLRRLDAARIRHIVAELPPATGLGVAIRDRLVKAAGRGGEELPF